MYTADAVQQIVMSQCREALNEQDVTRSDGVQLSRLTIKHDTVSAKTVSLEKEYVRERKSGEKACSAPTVRSCALAVSEDRCFRKDILTR